MALKDILPGKLGFGAAPLGDMVRAIPGASRPDRIAEDRAALEERVPADFRQELRAAGLVHPEAPLPAK